MKRRPSLRARLAASPPTRLVLFLDYDGTLAPIMSRPDEACLRPTMRKILYGLARNLPVVIVSGRSLPDLRKRVNIRGLHYIGCHGLMYQAPRLSVRWFGRRIARRVVAQWARSVRVAVRGIRGALVEDKGFSVALHDRLVRPAQRSLLRRRALRALAFWFQRGEITLVRGKRVLEVRPSGSWNKGTAVAKVLREPWARRRVPVYIGDDRTDFDAFRLMKGRGLGVRVSGRRGVAGSDAWLPDPRAVESLLRWLELKLRDV
jgi:trehalose-phosphatase